jgi:hypothetical protein
VNIANMGQCIRQIAGSILLLKKSENNYYLNAGEGSVYTCTATWHQTEKVCAGLPAMPATFKNSVMSAHFYELIKLQNMSHSLDRRWQVSQYRIMRVLDTVLVVQLGANFRDICVWILFNRKQF